MTDDSNIQLPSEQDFIAELQREFLDEVTFLLEQCEESYLKLENPDCRAEELTKIFRLAHSIKGTGAAVGIEDLAGFAHKVEDLLSILRNDPSQVTPEIISLLLKAGDQFKVRVEMLKAKSQDPWDSEELKKEILAVTQSLTQRTPGAPASAPAPAPVAAAPAPVPVAVPAAPAAPAPSADIQVMTKEPTPEELMAILAAMEPEGSSIPASVLQGLQAAADAAKTAAAAPAAEAPAPVETAPAEILPAPTETPAPPVEAAAPAPAQTPTPSKPANAPAGATAHGGHPPAAGGASQGQSVKLDSGRIDAVLDLVGELVVIKSQLLQEFSGNAKQSIRQNGLLALLDKTVRELQDKTLTMRMTSLKPMFLKMQRIVRDLAIKLDKPVEFVTDGEDIEIDRTMIDLLADPLVHITRNAVDHGIEKKAVRAERGKPAKATVKMTAKQAGGRVLIEIRDDGGGIDRSRVLKKAIDNGIVTEVAASRMTDRQVYDLLFAPGFSTAEKVTDVSGRGVGLDVVKSNIEKLKGTIDIESELGKGSTFRISLPLTTAIMDGIIVMIDGYRFVMPIDSIRELVQIADKSIIEITPDRKVVSVRDRVLPLIQMNEVLSFARGGNYSTEGEAAVSTGEQNAFGRQTKGMVVVIESLGFKTALRIDGVIGQSQVVVKSLGENMKSTSGIAGAAILGDGKIALVLDVDGLSRQINHVESHRQQEAELQSA